MHAWKKASNLAAIFWMALISGCTGTSSTKDAENVGAQYVVDNLGYAKAKNGVCFAVYSAPTHTVAIASIDCKQVGL